MYNSWAFNWMIGLGHDTTLTGVEIRTKIFPVWELNKVFTGFQPGKLVDSMSRFDDCQCLAKMVMWNLARIPRRLYPYVSILGYY